MRKLRPLVAVVDDDQSVRESLPDLLDALGFRASAFPSAEEFLSSGLAAVAKCLILDAAMPGMTGPELHRELRRRGRSLPTIFITAHRDEGVRPRLLAQGAVDCLYKPFSDTALQEALRSALRSG
ncbi:MAG TPA: response regulator [Thermoanaerobaculia bacterium]|nr:response regulator [Thermoanaerobaculia bacterium]